MNKLESVWVLVGTMMVLVNTGAAQVDQRDARPGGSVSIYYTPFDWDVDPDASDAAFMRAAWCTYSLPAHHLTAESVIHWIREAEQRAPDGAISSAPLRLQLVGSDGIGFSIRRDGSVFTHDGASTGRLSPAQLRQLDALLFAEARAQGCKVR